jgi:hypothetical protein
MTLEIDRMLTVCTSHVTLDDSQVLDEPNGELVSHKYEYGWLVWTGNGFRPELSNPANNLLEIARKNDCEWLRLDQAGDELEGLQVFEW